MVALVIGDKAVFCMPVVIARVFHPTLLDLFGVATFQLVTEFSPFGAWPYGCTQYLPSESQAGVSAQPHKENPDPR
jgi:hypothetical protein